MMKAVEYLIHLAYPGYSNNHKAKALHLSSLLIISMVLISYQLFLQSLPVTGIKILGYAAQIPSSEIVNLTNHKRSEAGLKELTTNVLLEQAARAKGEHMLEFDYWAHVSPDGTEPWAFFTDLGYRYRYAGENLARDFSNPQSAIDAWLASPSHKDNLLSDKYTEIGVAVVEGDLNGVDTTIIVQLFGTQLSTSSTQATVAEASTNTVVSPTPSVEITPTPTLNPASIAQISPNPTNVPAENLVTSTQSESEKTSGLSSLISPFNSTRIVSLITIISLLVVMVVDAIVIRRKQIKRVGGRTFAHLAFLGMVIAIVLIAKAGKIL